MAVSAGGALLAVVLGYVFHSAGPFAVDAAAAGLTPAATELVSRAAAEWRRKDEVVAEAALAASGLGDPEEFCARLSDSSDLIALAQKILWAASMSGNEDKLQMLGELLGGAVKARGDRVDEAQLLAAALTDLEAPHVMVLDVLTGPAPSPEAMLEGAGTAKERGWWSLTQVETAATPLDHEFVLACLNTLTSHGLTKTGSAYGGEQQWTLSLLGPAMAAVMSRARIRPQEG
jgi:hypothetical protein